MQIEKYKFMGKSMKHLSKWFILQHLGKQKKELPQQDGSV